MELMYFRRSSFYCKSTFRSYKRAEIKARLIQIVIESITISVKATSILSLIKKSVPHLETRVLFFSLLIYSAFCAIDLSCNLNQLKRLKPPLAGS